MKNKIIEESITSLQQEGLRFSVDTLAERLKVSKKPFTNIFLQRKFSPIQYTKNFIEI